MPGDFYHRDAIHDAAIDRVCEELAKHKIEAERWGLETERRALRRLLAASWDDLAIMERFKPDLAVLVPGVGLCHCEVKSAQPNRTDFMIEAKAAWAATQHGKRDPLAFYTFVEEDGGPIKACRMCEMALPLEINLPERWDNARNKAWLSEHFPGCWFKQTQCMNGSGTPYFFIWRGDAGFMALEAFVRSRLLSPRPATNRPPLQAALNLEF